MAGSDCGFSQSPLAGRVHRSITRAKLRTPAEGAAIASKTGVGGGGGGARAVRVDASRVPGEVARALLRAGVRQRGRHERRDTDLRRLLATAVVQPVAHPDLQLIGILSAHPVS